VRAKGRDAAGEGQAPAATSKARVLGYYPPQLFVDTDDLDAATTERVLAAVARAVEGVPGIARVYDLAHPGDDDGFLALMQASAPPGRAARLSVRQLARVVQLDEKGVAIGTDHGSPYAYDRRVPFLLAGPGVKRGRFVARVDARDVSATFAALLRVSPPDAGQGHPVEAVADR
jgi:hypothetical protein